MKSDNMIKAGVIGGIIIIIIELLVGVAAPSIVVGFSIIALLVGGAIAGWMVKGDLKDGLVAGGAAGLVYGIFGLLILYPLLSSRFRHTPAVYVLEIIVSIVVAALGGVVGRYIASHKGSSTSRKK